MLRQQNHEKTTPQDLQVNKLQHLPPREQHAFCLRLKAVCVSTINLTNTYFFLLKSCASVSKIIPAEESVLCLGQPSLRYWWRMNYSSRPTWSFLSDEITHDPTIHSACILYMLPHTVKTRPGLFCTEAIKTAYGHEFGLKTGNRMSIAPLSHSLSNSKALIISIWNTLTLLKFRINKEW